MCIYIYTCVLPWFPTLAECSTDRPTMPIAVQQMGRLFQT